MKFRVGDKVTLNIPTKELQDDLRLPDMSRKEQYKGKTAIVTRYHPVDGGVYEVCIDGVHDVYITWPEVALEMFAPIQVPETQQQPNIQMGLIDECTITGLISTYHTANRSISICQYPEDIKYYKKLKKAINRVGEFYLGQEWEGRRDRCRP